MSKALVNIKNNFDVTTIINSNQYPVKLEISESFDIETHPN